MLDRIVSAVWILFVLVIVPLPLGVKSWRKWGWDHVPSGNVDKNGKIIPARGPVGRRGHTLSLVAEDIVVLFGGRGPEKLVKHTPRSMELEFVGGTVEIKSYQGRVIGGTEEECLAQNKTLLECGRVVRFFFLQLFKIIYFYFLFLFHSQ